MVQCYENCIVLKPLVQSNKINASNFKNFNLGGHVENLPITLICQWKLLIYIHTLSSLNGYKKALIQCNNSMLKKEEGVTIYPLSYSH